MNNYTKRRQRWAFAAGALMVLVFVALVWALSGCRTPAAVVPSGDAAPQGEGCAPACANLARLKCPESATNAKGMTCTEVCQRAERLRDMNTACVASAEDIDELLGCRTVRCVW